jgi:hypothetical protein
MNLYTTPPAQPAPVQERNFCERCGKRLGSGIHTCTPPAELVQEPVALIIDGVLVNYSIPKKYTGPLYTTPPAAQRQWVGLTDDEMRQIFERKDYHGWLDYINAIEAKLRSKNNG